ncbi:ROK family protein [Leucobacter luti]|uniref:ROK family protein n=1 Tax=Leucobacter luti TaxID=340320 RepID=UPI0010D636CD|nr:ROK family protein [Leucobacter luti]MCW2289672.1 putative NBD/HSP70 family sugar kinase [Leucobacter luti]TCK37843.1 putative NBD/HSP70 family sugar kinase [Leucobacter luti]
MSEALRIGMDIGGSKTAAVALDLSGAVVASTQLLTERGPDGVLDTAEHAIRELARLTARSAREFASVGIGIPGQIDRELGVVRNAYNIDVARLALAELLSERTGLTVTLDNDVTAAAIGAAHLMGLSGTVAYLNLGTGLSAGFVVDGAPLRGSHGVAGEIGHLAVDRLERPCPCGQRGCLETVASGSALKTYWPAGGDHPGRILLSAIAAGDAEARTAFEYLVRGAANCVRLLVLALDPHTVVIGGGLRLLGDPLLDGIRTTLDEWSAASPFLTELQLGERVQVLPEDSSAAAVGAALAGIS